MRRWWNRIPPPSSHAAVSRPLHDVEGLKAVVAMVDRQADDTSTEPANAIASHHAIEAPVTHLMLQISKLWRGQYGPSAARRRSPVDRMELKVE